MTANQSTHQKECKRLSDELAGATNTLVRRMKKAVPSDIISQDHFSQWCESLEMAIRHPGEPAAVEQAMAAAEQLVTTLKARGVFQI